MIDYNCIKNHSFTICQSTLSKYYTDLKKDLKRKEAVVNSVFSENYCFVVQDEAQFFYWSNNSPVHPCTVYYNENGKVKHSFKK